MSRHDTDRDDDPQTQDPTHAQQARATVTPAECSALRLLVTDDYTQAELATMFEISEKSVSKHVNANCVIHAHSDHD